MSSAKLKEEFLNTRIQQIEITKEGAVIHSDDVLFPFSKNENIIAFHPFFEAIVGLLLTVSEDITYPCVNISGDNFSKILDIHIVQKQDGIYLLLFDFTEHYQDAHPLVQEKNEASIAKNRLAFDKRLLLAKESFKNNFLSNLNHEIRNPLNNLLGFMELLRKTKLSYDQNETLKVMQRTGSQIKHLMEDMLDISKIERGVLTLQHVPFNLGHIVTNLQQHYQLKIGAKTILLETTIEDNVPKKLLGDPVKLNQILFNLLENAYRNTTLGSINLTIKVQDQEDEMCTLNISVSDTGKGIPDSEITRVFDTYYQFKEETIKPIGEGLGLKIVKDLVTLLKGEIVVKSSQEGTVFTCQLPFETRKKDKKRPTVPKGSGIFLSKRILVIEDIEINQMLFMRIFLNNEKGMLLEIAQNAEHAFGLLAERNYKVIIIKNNLLDSSGLAFLKKCRQDKKLQNMPILVVSGNTMLKEQEQMLAAGASAFLSKPHTQKELFDSIEKLFS